MRTQGEVLLVFDRQVAQSLGDPDVVEDPRRTTVLQPKWRRIIGDVVDFPEPGLMTRVVQDRLAAIARSICLVMVSGWSPTFRPRWASWKPAVHSEAESWVVVVEAEATKHLTIRKGLRGLEEQSGLQWDGLFRIPGAGQ